MSKFILRVLVDLGDADTESRYNLQFATASAFCGRKMADEDIASWDGTGSPQFGFDCISFNVRGSDIQDPNFLIRSNFRGEAMYIFECEKMRSLVRKFFDIFSHHMDGLIEVEELIEEGCLTS